MQRGIPWLLLFPRLLSLGLLVLAGCQVAPTPTTVPTAPAPQPTLAPTLAPTTTPILPPPAKPTLAPTATPALLLTVPPAPTPPPAALTLTILEPADEAVVKDSLLRVSGRTAPDAVVSVNGRLVRAINEDGNFTTTVTLLEGPNLVEVMATDYQGSQASRVLTVIYLP